MVLFAQTCNGITIKMENVINQFFPGLPDDAYSRLIKLGEEFTIWNEKINLVSRKDIDNILVAHILHSLAIAKFITFTQGSRVMDLGCGGGLPGLPLAIVFPNVHFHLIDRIGKKVNAASQMASSLGLDNVSFMHGDSGECHEKFDFVVSRAVMPQEDLIKAVRRNISTIQKNAMPNGLISLKGGDLNAELGKVRYPTDVVDIHQWFPLPFFETKKLVYTVLS